MDAQRIGEYGLPSDDGKPGVGIRVSDEFVYGKDESGKVNICKIDLDGALPPPTRGVDPLTL